jgi:hypothetical protein
VVLGETATVWVPSELGRWAILREESRRVWVGEQGLKLRIESADATGEVFKVHEAVEVLWNVPRDHEAPWRTHGVQPRITYVTGSVPADPPGAAFAEMAERAGMPVAATVYVTGTPHSGRLSDQSADISWAAVYEPADASFALVVAPADRPAPLSWSFWPGTRSLVRAPVRPLDVAALDLPVGASAFELLSRPAVMVTWVEHGERAVLLALDVAQGLDVAQKLAASGP